PSRPFSNAPGTIPMTELVLSEPHGEVTLRILNRPNARTALSPDLTLAMQAAFDDCLAAPACRAMVVRGAEGHFCSGGDVSGMQNERSIAESRRRMEIFHHLARTIVGGPKPVIAAVEGYAAGAGFSLALNTDYLVAATDARFNSSFAKVGLDRKS